MDTPIPLEKWPALRTPSVDVAENALVSIYGARKFEVRKTDSRFYAHANYKALHDISFSFCSYTSPVTIGFPEAPFFRQAFSLKGAGNFSIGRRETQVSRQRADVVPAGVALTADFSAGFQQLLLRVNEAALVRKLSALIGAAPTRKIEFSDTFSGNTRSVDALHRLIAYVVSEIDGSPDALPAQAVVELEQAVLTTFLFSNSHNFSKLLDQKPSTLAPWQVRRTEEYIEANWQDAITIESIAEDIGASARSIFLSFSKARGYSPMAFVKKNSSAPRTAKTAISGSSNHCHGRRSRMWLSKYGAFRDELP